MRIDRNAQPTRYTPADRARMAHAVAQHDKRMANARAWNRIYRLAYCAGIIAVAAALAYGAMTP